jgi:hypothetical protein
MRNKYKGMTVNERLYVSGLMDKFDAAVKKKDVATLFSILEKVELTEQSIVPVLESLQLYGEIHNFKRKNFINNTQKYFKFLETKFEFSKPNHLFYKQENGTVISDEMEYENILLNIKIVIANYYHPVDYGFQINIIDMERGTNEVLCYVLKEKQDMKQEYLKEYVEVLKKYCKKIVCKNGKRN